MKRPLALLFCLCAALSLALAGCGPRPRLAVASGVEAPYLLGSGDRLRITVFNQPNLSASYAVDASGVVTLPLLGSVPAAGRSPSELKNAIESRLRREFLREPNVSVEVESYRPFFIFGEVIQGGQYPYIAGMTVEQAVAVAGGYTPRASQGQVQLARRESDGVYRTMVPLTTIVKPGDTLFVKERWF